MLDMVKNLGKRPTSPSRLTDELARSAPLVERGSAYDLFDSELKGFHLRVGRLGKSWCIRTHYSTGPGTHKTIRAVIGATERMSEETARELAGRAIRNAKASGRVDTGNEPSAQTVKEVFALYLVQLAKREARPRTIDFYRGTFKRIEAYHARRFAAFRREDAETIHKDITERSGKSAANQTLRLLRAMWNHLDDAGDDKIPGMADKNPFRDSRRHTLFHKEKTRAHLALGPDELPAWAKQVTEIEDPIRRAMHAFTLLSGLRTGSLLPTWARETQNNLAGESGTALI